VNANALAKELAAAVAASLPDGFTATAEGEMVTIETPDGTGVSTSLDLDEDDLGDREVYADAAEGVLSFAQDVVCEALDATWPTAGPATLDLPIPGARADDGVLHLWYGDEDAPVLTLKAIRLIVSP
jgi:hypothetical protein